MDPDNTKAVTSLADKTPSTVGDVRKLVGLLGYYHHFIHRLSVFANPLYDLLTTPTRLTSYPSCKVTGKKKVLGQLNSSSKVTWKKEHQAALGELLYNLTTPLLLAYPDAIYLTFFTLMHVKMALELSSTKTTNYLLLPMPREL